MQISRFIKRVGLFTIQLTLGISIITAIFTPSLNAKTKVLFSPGGSIREAIVKTINSSQKTIDIAAFTFTAGDIAEALYKAKEKGVEIRVIIDQRQAERNYPVIEFLKDEGFNMQFLKGNIGGSMNNTFAIFDDTLVVTGSYNWTEYAEKFNYENVLFIDDTDVVTIYSEEFGLLYNESVVQGGRGAEKQASTTAVSWSGVQAKPIDEGASSNALNVDKEKSQKETSGVPESNTVASVTGMGNENDPADKKDKQIDAIPNQHVQFVDISFIEFDKIFNNESKLKKSEKARLWKEKFEGRYIRWTGKIGFKGIAVYDWNKVGISHKGGDVDVNLKFDWSKQRKVMKLKVGDIVTYTGKLVSLNSFFSSYRVEDVDLIQVR